MTLDDAGTGRVELRIELERLDSEAPLTLAAEILGQRVESAVDAGSAAATLIIDVPDAPVWWPVGYGEQPLAELTLTLSTGDQELDRWQRRIGFRTRRTGHLPRRHRHRIHHLGQRPAGVRQRRELDP